MSAPAAGLKSASLDDLAAMLATADDDLRAAVMRECDRRDRADIAARKREAERREWHDAAYAQYLAAEAETRGVLLNNRHRDRDISPWPDLWTGSEARAMARASEELREYWAAHARVTVTGYRRQLADARRAQADERERDSVTLPDSGDELAELVRVHGDAILNSYESAGIDEYVDAAEAAAWFGLAVKTVYIEMSPSRNRWPQPDKRFGRAGAWSRRTLVLHRARMTGQGAPGRARAKRKVN